MSLLLLLLGIWMIIIDIVALRFLVNALRSGILQGKRGYRTDRRKSPAQYWFGIFLTALIVAVFLFFGCSFVFQALR